MVPVDDHLVHRGDGVFETLKCVNGRIYLRPNTWPACSASATAIGLNMPVVGAEALTDIMVQTVRAGRQRDCLDPHPALPRPGQLRREPLRLPPPRPLHPRPRADHRPS
jgi:hypothetical protein